MSDKTLSPENKSIELVGDLVFPNIYQIRQKTEASISAQVGDCVLDFSKVGKVDSSSLSLCLCFLRLAKKQNKEVTFINLPDDMVSIADLVGLDANAHFHNSH
ncbi:STAS domain-containing protein [Neptunomonas antarctica]|uniref:Phospholipid transport system transporter-binding protein n=1 Tax=Neptunomonas antarctica TaxID=619304 RepID=A0A1N7NXF6_9GAMM|nr:STAS domain-containing protein [Neptunomonas antarctica]SIT03027.1 phospholipid transport system transporter-binding protein [Neptunomonas antarctica]